MAEERHDLFAEMLDNQQGTLDQMILAGLTPDNTYILSKELYKKDKWILDLFKDENGLFDNDTFEKAYDLSLMYYDALGSKTYEDSVNDLLDFHRNNYLAPKESRRTGPDFKEIKISNPREQVHNLIQLGRVEAPTLSDEELAQKNRVLLNPRTAGENLENAKWGDSPNGHFFKYSLDTLVLALYDEDGTHIDPITGQTVEHRAGDLKLDENGRFYYEDLDGRDVYGKRVLNKMNVLTVDDSFWNKFDFFDSDDIELKSLFGSVMKNLALVGTMFLPVVGPWIAGLSIGTLLIGLAGTLGKMLIDSDNYVFSEMEGWALSVSRLTAKTQYSLENTWTWENFINLIGDVMGLLREQRFIFNKLPQAIYKSDLSTKAGTALKLKELELIYDKFNKTNLEDLLKGKNVDYKQYIKNYNALKEYTINNLLENLVKKYLDFGRKASMGYMTAITVSDMYGELKLSGAELWESVLATLGYAAAEYALINSELGRWILPELKNNKFRNQAIIRASTKISEDVVKLRELFGDAIKAFPKENKKEYAKKLFEIGKKAARAEYSNGTKTLKATLGSGVAEGIEEVSEEVLADVFRGINNTIQWLQGDESRADTFGYNFKEGKWDFLNLVDRYGMSLIGGFVGGGLTNVATNYNLVKSYNNMTYDQAIQEMVYMIRNGEIDEFIKDLDNTEIGRKDLSATEFDELTDENGNITYIYKPGTDTDNLDLFIKNGIKREIKMLADILRANGAKISDSSFLNKLTELLGNLRYSALHKSMTAGWYLNELNTLSSDLTKLLGELNALMINKKDANGDGVVTDKEARSETEEANAEIEENIKKTKAKVEETKKKLQALINGDRSYEFVSTALFELTPELSYGFTFPNFILFAEAKYGKKFQDITDAEKEAARQVYSNWKQVEGKQKIMDLAAVFRKANESGSTAINNGSKWYKLYRGLIKEINKQVQKLIPNALDVDIILAQVNHAAISVIYDYIKKFGISSDIEKIDNEMQEISKNPNTDEETKKITLANKGFERDGIIASSFYNIFKERISPILKGGYLNTEAKNALILLLRTTIDLYDKNSKILDINFNSNEEEKENFQYETFESLEERNARQKELEDESERIRTSISKINTNKLEIEEYIKSILELKETPFEDSYNEFLISMGENPINITELLNQTNALFNDTIEDVSKFSTEYSLELLNAINTLKIYRAAVLAARTDAVDVDNIYGYNVTLNELAKKMKGDFPQLAEIDSSLADVMVSDIDAVLNKLLFHLNLFELNLGRILSKLDNVAFNKDMLLYKRFKSIVTVPDDDKLKQWEGFDELKAAVYNLSLHEDLEKSKAKSIPTEKRVEFELENIKFLDTIYDFFLKNQDKINDVDKLTEFINAYRFNLYTKGNNLLTENSTSIDDNSIIWWIASKAAIKASSFYGEYKLILDPSSKNLVAPIPTQELGVYLTYASILNGGIFELFTKAYRKAVKDDWKNKTQELREEIINKLDLRMKADDNLSDYIFSFIPVPRYSNILFIEGVPGSGKSYGVFNLVVKLLQKFHPEILDRVAVVHGASQNSALNLLTNLQLNDKRSKAYDRIGWMKEVNPSYIEYLLDDQGNYIIPKNDYDFTTENEIRSILGITETSTPPSLIIIDEISKFTTFDLDLILNYAQKYGITVITAGDFDQTKVVGKHVVTLNGKDYNNQVELNRINMIRTPKLGVSMRSDNTILTQNVESYQLYLQNPKNQVLLGYYEDDTGIYGTKLLLVNTSIITDQNSEEVLSKTITDIDLLVKTLKPEEKIGYIYLSENSPIYKLLSSEKYSKYIDFRKGTSALGDESQYYIIEATESEEAIALNPRWHNDVYTGISRSKQGSLLITHFANKSFNIKKFDNKLDLTISAKSLLDFILRRIDLLNKAIPEGGKTEFTARTKNQDIVSVPSKSNNNTLPEGIDTTPITETPEYKKYKGELIDRINNSQSKEELNQILEEAELKYPRITHLPDIVSVITSKTFSSNLLTIDEDNIPDDEKDLLKQLSVDNTDVNLGDDELNVGDIVKFKFKDLEIFGVIKEIDSDNYKIQVSAESKKKGIDDQTIKREDILGVVKQLNPPDNSTEDHEADEKDEYSNNKAPVVLTLDLSNEEYKDAIDSSNESKNPPRSSVTIENGVALIDMLLHSFNTFELGCLVDEKTDLPKAPTGNDPNNPEESTKRQRARKDSINGLLRIDYLHGIKDRKVHKSENGLRSFISILADLRNSFFTIGEKAKLIEDIEKQLKLQGVYITFGLKNHARHDKDNKLNFLESDPTPFNKSKEERTLFNGSSDARSSEWHNRALVAIIGTKENGDLLELPLLAISSPLTLLKMQDESGAYIFSEMSALYDKLIKEDKKTVHEAIVELISKFENNKYYENLVNLLKLFNFTDRTIQFIHDDNWTIANGFESIGPQFVTRRGIYQSVPGFDYDSNSNPLKEWTTIDKFKENPSVRVTDHVYVSLDGKITDANGNDVKVCNQGNPFVLVSYDNTLSTDVEIYEYFEKQLSDPSVLPRVKLMYVYPPAASIREYAENLRLALSSNKTDRDSKKHIGNMFTSFLLFNQLMNNTEFNNMFQHRNKSLYDKVYEARKTILDLMSSGNFEAAKNALFDSSLDWSSVGFKNRITLARMLDMAMYHVLYNINNLRGNSTVVGLNEGNVNLVQRIIGKDNGVRYDAWIPRKASPTMGPFYAVTPLNTYSIDRKPYLINGKMDSPIFKGSIDGLVKDFLNSLVPTPKNKNHKCTKEDHLNYFMGRSSINLNILSKEDMDKLTLKNRVKKNSGIELDTSVTIQEMQRNAVNEINKKNNKKIAFINNKGELVISKEHNELSGLIVLLDTENNAITQIPNAIQGVSYFRVDIDGTTYNASYSNKLLLLEEIVLPTLDDVELNKAFNTIIKNIDIVNEVMDNDIDFSDLLNASANYQEFKDNYGLYIEGSMESSYEKAKNEIENLPEDILNEELKKELSSAIQTLIKYDSELQKLSTNSCSLANAITIKF